MHEKPIYTFIILGMLAMVDMVGCGSNSNSSSNITYSISGTVSGAISQGVTMTLNGGGSGTGSRTVMTNENGNYSFSGIANGTYTITPSLSGYTFTPSNSQQSINGASISNVNFTATLAAVTPNPPAGLSQTTVNKVPQVTLIWQASAGADTYTVYATITTTTCPSSGYTSVGTTAGLVYTDTNLISGTTYCFAVTAKNGAGESGYSNITSTSILAVPSSLNIVVPDDSSVVLTWGASVSAASYNVYISTVSGSGYTQTQSGLVTTATTITGLTYGTTYYFVVTAVNRNGETGYSSQKGAYLAQTPNGLTASPGPEQATLNWNATILPLQYNIYDNAGYVGFTDSTNTTYTATSLTDSNQYDFTVTAVYITGESAGSGPTSTIPMSAPVAVAYQSGLNAVTISWTGSTGANGYSGYEQQQKPLGPWISIFTDVTTFSQTTGATDGDTYDFTVTAINGLGQEGSASGITGVTLVQPFNVITATVTQFNPAYVSGMACLFTDGTTAGPPPCSNYTASTYLTRGYQGGDIANNVAVFTPWEIAGSTTSSYPIINGYLLTYTGGTSSSHFTNPTYWQVHNMNADQNDGVPISCPNTEETGTANYCPGGYNYGVVVTTGTGAINYYLVPGWDCTPACDYALINATNPDPTQWTYSYLPQSATTPSSTGFATAQYDGKYINFIPTWGRFGSPVVFVRHDTTQDTGSTLSTTGWQAVDLATCPGWPSNCAFDGQRANCAFNGSGYDGHRYVYAVPMPGSPTSSPYLGILDTSASAGFGCSQWTTFDMSKLGTSGYPAVVGGGTIANLAGVGAAIVGIDGDTNNGTAWLYLAGWATASGFTTDLILSGTAARVQAGIYSNGTFYPQGSPGGPPYITSTTATWEVVDLGQLAVENLAFAAAGFDVNPGAYFTQSGVRNGQLTVSSWQLGWWNPVTRRVILNASDGKFEVELDPSKHLWDPTGWYLSAITNPNLTLDEYGGPALLGPVGGTTIYPSTPMTNDLLQIGGE
ncbi:MAG: fibronectin type III domain-containing protein [Deltaproteobacteria bacterium]|nr:fibronectin type III domain-containing protein [Deltaproteobacteria bacterium]